LGGNVSKVVNKLMLDFDWRLQHGQRTIGQISILWQLGSRGGKDPMWSNEVFFGVDDFFHLMGLIGFLRIIIKVGGENCSSIK